MRIGHYFTVVFIILLSVLPAESKAQMKTPANPYGGHRMLREFIRQELVYPENALKNNVKGTVGLNMSIDEEGNTQDIIIFQSVDPELDAEALRIMRKIMWEPALYMGTPIADFVYTEIEFNPKKYGRYCRERGFVRPVYPRLPVDSSDRVFSPTAVDTLPRLLFEEEGMTLSRFISRHIEYPEEAMRNNLSGTETVHFIVEPSGRISNVQPTKHLGAGCCEETVRLVKLLKWYPGIHENKAVRVMMNISITFNLTQNSDFLYIPTFLNNSMQ